MARWLAFLILLLACAEYVLRWVLGGTLPSAEWAAIAAGGLIWLAGSESRVRSFWFWLRRVTICSAAVTVLVIHARPTALQPASLLFSGLLWVAVLLAEALGRLRRPQRPRDLRLAALAGLLSVSGLTGAALQIWGPATVAQPAAADTDQVGAAAIPPDAIWLGQAEDLVARVAGGELVRQPMEEFRGEWGGGLQAFVGTSKPGAEIALTLSFPHPVVGRLLVRLTGAVDYGRVEIDWPGARAPLLVDTYSPEVKPLPWLEVASGTIEPGEIILRNAGRSESSLGFQIGVDAVAISRSLPP